MPTKPSISRSNLAKDAASGWSARPRRGARGGNRGGGRPHPSTKPRPPPPRQSAALGEDLFDSAAGEQTTSCIQRSRHVVHVDALMTLVRAAQHAVTTTHAVLSVVREGAGSVSQPFTTLQKDAVVLVHLGRNNGHHSQRRLHPLEVGPKGIGAQGLQ